MEKVKVNVQNSVVALLREIETIFNAFRSEILSILSENPKDSKE